MRKTAAVLSLLLASGLAAHAAGVKYSGSVRTEGGPAVSAQQREAQKKMGLSPDGMNFDFEVVAEGGRVRENFLSDFAFFKKGDYMLADASTKVAHIVMPAKKEFVEMDLDHLLDLGKQMQASMKMTYSDQKAEVTDLPPKVIGGYPCTGKKVSLSYTVTVSVMGFTNRSHTQEVTEYYTTDQFDILKYFGGITWHRQGIATGDEAFDKTIAAKMGKVGFPVEIRTHKIVEGKDQGTTVFTVRDVQVVPAVLPGTFTLPAGYAKTTLDPLRMMGGRGGEGQDAPQGMPNLDEIMKQLGDQNRTK